MNPGRIRMAGERILIVEDEPAVARGLEYALKNEGYEVLWADTGEKALTLARRRDPHLIIPDIRLPDPNGFKVRERMHGAGLRQPILMPMALDKEMDRAASLEAGADDNVAKSHRFQERTAQVQARLRRAYGELALAARGSGSVSGTRRWTWSPSR